MSLSSSERDRRTREMIVVRETQRRQSHPLIRYRPYPKQAVFHAEGLTHRERLLRAGNQNGKTYSAGAEMSFHLTGMYPDDWEGRVFDHPILAWASGPTGEATRDNAQRVLFGLVGQWGSGLVPDWKIGTHKPARGVADLKDYVKIKHKTGGWSTLRFKYYEQGREKWQGPPVDVVWFDEEPPEDIYSEGLARTIATGGIVYLSFTPLLGMSEVVRRFLMEDNPDRSDTNMTIEDAEHIPPEERKKIIEGFPAHERDARVKGIPILGSGRIYPVVEESITVEPFAIPDVWAQIGGLDFGWDHPTAAVKVAWDRDTDTVYVTAAYRASGPDVLANEGQLATPVLHAAKLLPWGDWLPWSWPPDGLQTEKGSGIQLAPQYRKQGMNLIHEHAQFPEENDDTKVSRVSVEAGIQDILTRMQTDRFKVFSHLSDWFEEFRLYHREDGKIVKVYDDLLDATRYALMMLRYAKSVAEIGAGYEEPPPPDWRT